MSGEALFKQHATTFYQASRFFSKNDRKAIASLYAFCRTVDDLADEKQDLNELKRLKKEIRENNLKTFPTLQFLVKERGIPSFYMERLIESVEEDLTPRHLCSHKELIHYCTGVGSTVGLMICKILKVKDPTSLIYAIDLGIGMQLTNIARDVWADAEKGFLYLPNELFPQNFFTPKMSLKEKTEKILASFEDEVFTARCKLLDFAKLHYKNAEKGYYALPLRARCAISLAATHYEQIGGTILKNPKVKRARVAPIRKVMLSPMSFYKAFFPKKPRPPFPTYSHLITPSHKTLIKNYA